MKHKSTLITTALFATCLAGSAFAGGSDMTKNPLSFNELDANHDGTITLEEFTQAKNGFLKQQTTLSQQLGDDWKKLDTNNDGKLERSEFARFEPTMNASDMSKEMSKHQSATDKDHKGW